MIMQSVWQKSFDFFGKPVVVRPSEAELTSDAGLPPIRQFDQRVGLTERSVGRGYHTRTGGTRSLPTETIGLPALNWISLSQT